jgi:hypothetical protein
VTIGYGHCLSQAVSGDGLVPLPITLPFRSGEALVLQGDLRDEPAVAALIHTLKERLAHLQPRFPELSLAP